ncbi:Cadmium, zinc and cobalt-transporting ATPase [Methylibium sp. T29-B]|nr:Cadmium, zinc and cobalt-transporting ATPase [Methylibium sp. T29-B]
MPEPQQYEQIQARGVKATVEGRAVLVGNPALLSEAGVALPSSTLATGATAAADAAGIGSSTPVHVAVDGRFAGIVYIADAVRPGAREALVALKATGVKRTVMLTGDNAATAHAVAQQLGIDEVHAELLPEGKVGVIAELQKQGHRVAMVGDGINDAPALARADVGIAMGGGGTQAALEAADVALMTDDLAKIGAARAIARPRLPHGSGEPVRRRGRGACAGHCRRTDGLDRADRGRDHPPRTRCAGFRQLGEAAAGAYPGCT